MGRLFGTNGVRGVVNKELTVEMVTGLAASAGAILGKEIAIGRDGRTSSPMFRDATVSGLLSVGCKVCDVGILPTPALEFAVMHLKLDGGVMVTASHNPPEFNGLKVVAEDGVEIPPEVETSIEESFFSGGPVLKSWHQIGRVSCWDVLPEYKKAIISHVDDSLIRRTKLKIAIDPGNGVATLIAPEIARKLGCKVYTINADLNGYFPGRESEPRPDTLEALKKLVVASNADLGVAFDGDGDRSMFVDENGEIHWGDRSVALVAKDFVNRYPGAKVATAVSSSRVIEDVVKEGGGKIVWTKVGSVAISRTMVNQDILLGGEENGGLMYGPHLQVRDGSMAMALILEILAKSGRSLSELFGRLPQYSQMKDRVQCPNELKQKTLEKLKVSVKADKIETIDGVKLWYDDGSWILIRPSGTEPIFRLYAEASSHKRVRMLVESHIELVDSIIKDLH